MVLYFSLPFISAEMVFTLCLKIKGGTAVQNQDTEQCSQGIYYSQAYHRKNKDLPMLDIKWLGLEKREMNHCAYGGIVYTVGFQQTLKEDG